MKIKRDAFLYYDGTRRDFAQCGSCWLFTSKARCVVLQIPVNAEDSCGYYGKGTWHPGINEADYPVFTREEVGYVRRQVRCENCAHFDAGRSVCYLFETLNNELELFDLDVKVMPRGCCNAQVPKA